MTEKNKDQKEVEVLYQKIGAKWYAFSVVGDEIFTGSLSEDELTKAGEVGIEKYFEINESSNGEAEVA
jgi:hypothetical protein